MVNSSIEAALACPANAGVTRHRSSSLSSKEDKVTGMIADNNIFFLLVYTFQIIIEISFELSTNY